MSEHDRRRQRLVSQRLKDFRQQLVEECVSNSLLDSFDEYFEVFLLEEMQK